ncbi:MAG: dihydrolipoyl dehydrogenase [Candidatus Omnitrophota bacterium]
MFDLGIIGSGWAGFNAAITAAKLGAKVVLFEDNEIGGVCLNRGCIPTKTLAHSARLLASSRHYSKFGLEVKGIDLVWENLQSRKTQIVEDLQKGICFQLNSAKVEVVKSRAKIAAANLIEADGRAFESRFIIIATGSAAAELPFLKFDHHRIISSDDILSLNRLPQNLLIIGAGAIGCEFASIFSALKVKVTIIELMENLLPGEDREASRKLEAVFKKSGIRVLTKTRVEDIDLKEFDKILVCVGRRIDTGDLFTYSPVVKTQSGRILVNEFLQTSEENIYAAGDCTGIKLLAHVAAYQGRRASENIFGRRRKADYHAIPNCIFTNPEVASVGIGEQEAKASGREIITSKFDWLASGMARILEEPDGFIKLVADKSSGELLGASLIGPKATELIGVLTLAVQQQMKIKDINETIFAHPSLCEGLFEAAEKLNLADN